MTEEMVSRVKGTILGLVSRGQFPQREPVAYLYGHVAKEGETPTHTINGVEYVGAVLPALPEYDKTVYQYATLFYHETSTVSQYVVFVTDIRPYAEEYNVRIQAGSKCTVSEINVGEAEWGTFYESDFPNGGLIDNDLIIWSNFDLLFEDGSVFLDASDPIQIYE